MLGHAPWLRQELGPDHPAVQAAAGMLPEELVNARAGAAARPAGGGLNRCGSPVWA